MALGKVEGRDNPIVVESYAGWCPRRWMTQSLKSAARYTRFSGYYR